MGVRDRQHQREVDAHCRLRLRRRNRLCDARKARLNPPLFIPTPLTPLPPLSLSLPSLAPRFPGSLPPPPSPSVYSLRLLLRQCTAPSVSSLAAIEPAPQIIYTYILDSRSLSKSVLLLWALVFRQASLTNARTLAVQSLACDRKRMALALRGARVIKCLCVCVWCVCVCVRVRVCVCVCVCVCVVRVGRCQRCWRRRVRRHSRLSPARRCRRTCRRRVAGPGGPLAGLRARSAPGIFTNIHNTYTYIPQPLPFRVGSATRHNREKE
jgi:hypothetical protein